MYRNLLFTLTYSIERLHIIYMNMRWIYQKLNKKKPGSI